jgi:hypothetical protein
VDGISNENEDACLKEIRIVFSKLQETMFITKESTVGQKKSTTLREELPFYHTVPLSHCAGKGQLTSAFSATQLRYQPGVKSSVSSSLAKLLQGCKSRLS